mmetsp:Transcript_47006/g.68990  ORF Transcript_47006/g.68990 Transcript_47006/m.68990 type:complete len:90 (-) Transcript_47006:21-290(-)
MSFAFRLFRKMQAKSRAMGQCDESLPKSDTKALVRGRCIAGLQQTGNVKKNTGKDNEKCVRHRVNIVATLPGNTLLGTRLHSSACGQYT